MSRSAQQLREFLSAIVQEPDKVEKVASSTDEEAIAADEIVGLSVALGNAYRDPILANLMEAGDLRNFSRLATGRYLDEATASKVASMAPDDVRELTAQGLLLTREQKTAEKSKPKTAFPHIFRR